MSEVVTAAPAPPVVRLPPAVRGPKLFQGLAFVVSRRRLLGRFVRRYGKAFTANILMYGRVVVVADPQLARQVFTSSPEELGNIQPNLSRMFGSGSVFALDGDDHRRRRRLLAPPFHGKSMKNYETIIEEETLRETANWPQGQAFATLPSMMHITLNAILRAIFGAGGSELDELRRLIPPWVTLGSRLAALPKPKRDYGRLSPWGRLAEWRRQYDTVIDKLIEAERADPNFADRTDVLALMLRSTYDDGSIMSRKDIGDELLTLLAAGHETTAATLGWAFERLSRHPDVLAALVEEVDNGGHELRQAAILEVQRAARGGHHARPPAGTCLDSRNDDDLPGQSHGGLPVAVVGDRRVHRANYLRIGQPHARPRRRQRDQRDEHFDHHLCRQWPVVPSRRHLQPVAVPAGGDEVVSQGAGVGHPRRGRGALDAPAWRSLNERTQAGHWRERLPGFARDSPARRRLRAAER